MSDPSEWIDFGGHWSRIPLPEGDDWDVDEFDRREETETFVGQGLNKPGTQVEVYGKIYLIGDINKVGGVCDDCMGFGRDSIVTRYRVLVEVEPVKLTHGDIV